MDRESVIIKPENKPFIHTRFLPKTGQVTSFFNGDDGWYEKGWAIGGRFVAKTILGDGVVYDRTTGLMWGRDHDTAIGNNGNTKKLFASIVYMEGLTFAGFSDWRMPNILELLSIVQYEPAPPGPYVYPVFQNWKNDRYWTSTAYPPLVTSYKYVDFMTTADGSDPTNTFYFIMGVRKGSPW